MVPLLCFSRSAETCFGLMSCTVYPCSIQLYVSRTHYEIEQKKTAAKIARRVTFFRVARAPRLCTKPGSKRCQHTEYTAVYLLPARRTFDMFVHQPLPVLQYRTYTTVSYTQLCAPKTRCFVVPLVLTQRYLTAYSYIRKLRVGMLTLSYHYSFEATSAWRGLTRAGLR